MPTRTFAYARLLVGLVACLGTVLLPTMPQPAPVVGGEVARRGAPPELVFDWDPDDWDDEDDEDDWDDEDPDEGTRDVGEVASVVSAGSSVRDASPAPRPPVTARAHLTPAGGCEGCRSQLGSPARLLPAPPERRRRGPWLVRHQGEDGNWSVLSPWDDPCWTQPGHRAGDPQGTVGTTALAILSFVSAGDSHRGGSTWEEIGAALAWLRERQGRDGSFVAAATAEADRDQALATAALVELYGVSRDWTLKGPAQRAVDVCLDGVLDRVVDAPDPALGGWVLVALRHARLAALEVPDDGFARLRATFPIAEEAGPTALLAHLWGGGSRRDPGARACAERLAAEALRWEPRAVDLQRWYLTTRALFEVGGRPWKAWRTALLDVLGGQQRPQVHSATPWGCGSGSTPADPPPPMDCREGSWDPIGAWGAHFGRAGTTALARLCLAVYDRYERMRASAPEFVR